MDEVLAPLANATLSLLALRPHYSLFVPGPFNTNGTNPIALWIASPWAVYLFAQDLESQLGAKSLLLHSLSMADKVAEARKLCDDLIGLQDCDSPQMPDILIMVSLALHAQGEEERAQQVLEMAKKLRGDEDPEGTLEHTQKVLNETSKKKNKD